MASSRLNPPPSATASDFGREDPLWAKAGAHHCTLASRTTCIAKPHRRLRAFTQFMINLRQKIRLEDAHVLDFGYLRRLGEVGRGVTSLVCVRRAYWPRLGGRCLRLPVAPVPRTAKSRDRKQTRACGNGPPCPRVIPTSLMALLDFLSFPIATNHDRHGYETGPPRPAPEHAQIGARSGPSRAQPRPPGTT